MNKQQQMELWVAAEVFFCGNPANGYRLPALTGSWKDKNRVSATAGVIQWWHEVKKNEALFNWAATTLVDQASAFGLPPHWNDRPVWGTLRRHARDGGGLTVRLLESVARSTLRWYRHGQQSDFTPFDGYWMGIQYLWERLVREASLFLKGEESRFETFFPMNKDLMEEIEVRRTIRKWFESLTEEEKSEAVQRLLQSTGWCSSGVERVAENPNLIEDRSEVSSERLSRAVMALYRVGFKPLTDAVKDGRISLSEVL